MSYVTILWSGSAAAALLLGLVHGLVWLNDRDARANLAFAFAGLGLAGAAITELGMLSASGPDEWGRWVWWTHWPLYLNVIAMAIFLRLYLRAGRLWLLVTLIVARTVVLLVNSFSTPNVNFARIDAVKQIPFLGEPVTVMSNAVMGDFQWFALITSIIYPLFILDVVVTLWRRKTRESHRQALVVGGPVLVAVVLSVVLSQLALWQVVRLPTLLIPPFLISLAAMAFELSRDTVRASRLARDLRISERRLQLAADAAGAGLWEWNARNGRIWATEQTRRILGLPPDGDIHPEGLWRIADPADARLISAALDRALSNGGEHAMQFRIVTPDGATRWIAAHGMVDLDPQRNPKRSRGVVRDVTQQRLAEDETNELRRNLLHVGRVTTLGQLSSALAHELSQPLSAIQHNIETAQLLLRRDPVDLRELTEIVDDVLRDDRRAAEVVQRLRAWLKQGRLQSESIRLVDLVNDVLAIVHSDAVFKHVTIECAVPSNLPPVLGDRVHLSQVLLNLVMNALEAIAAADVQRRHIRIEAEDREDGLCEVAVSDSGPGIRTAKIDQVFEPFFTSKTDGMGIGLSISRKIMESHGGRLWAENGTHGGATFRFTVPTQVSRLAQRA